MQQRKVALKPLVTDGIALEDLVEYGFDTLISNNEKAVKVLVHRCEAVRNEIGWS